jgi:hypothetical protein
MSDLFFVEPEMNKRTFRAEFSMSAIKKNIEIKCLLSVLFFLSPLKIYDLGNDEKIVF